MATLLGALLIAGCGAPTAPRDGRADPDNASTSEATTPNSNASSTEGATGAVEGQGEGRSDSRREDTPVDGNADGPTRQTGAVELERTDVDADRAIEPESTAIETAAEELRTRGRIGDDDVLTPAGERVLGDRVFSRARQEHKDIPVFAAEVVVTVEGDRIVKIRGHAAPRIELATTTPAHDYPATVGEAERLVEPRHRDRR